MNIVNNSKFTSYRLPSYCFAAPLFPLNQTNYLLKERSNYNSILHPNSKAS